MDEPRTLSVEQAAAQLGISRSAAYRAIKADDIPHIRVGGRILVVRAALDQMLGAVDQSKPEPADAA